MRNYLNKIKSSTRLTVFLILSLVACSVFGLIISSWIGSGVDKQNEIYNKALRLDSIDAFNYAVDTQAGNMFAPLELTAIDPIQNEWLTGEYLLIEIKKEVYTPHTRNVTHRNSDGTTYTTTEIYWSWDYAGSQTQTSQRIVMNQREYAFDSFSGFSAEYMGTEQRWSDTRYKYYAVPYKLGGALYANVTNEGINGKIKVMEGKTVYDAYETSLSSVLGWQIAFWIIWVLGWGIFIFFIGRLMCG